MEEEVISVKNLVKKFGSFTAMMISALMYIKVKYLVSSVLMALKNHSYKNSKRTFQTHFRRGDSSRL